MRRAMLLGICVIALLLAAPDVQASTNFPPVRSALIQAPPPVVLFSDNFDGKDQQWSLGSSADGDFRRADGQLLIRDLVQSEDPTGVEAPLVADNVVIEVDGKLVDGAESTWLSVFCRGKGGSDFAFYWRVDGWYSAVLWLDDQIAREDEQARTDAIHTGKGVVNHVKVSCMGNRLQGWINGAQLVDWTDDRLGAGVVGLGVEGFDGESNEAAFDNFIVYGETDTEKKSPTSSVPTVGGLKVTVNNPTLNVRAGPGTTFAKIGAVKQGDELLVRGRNDGCSWVLVDAPAGAGWVSAGYVNFNGDCTLAPVAGAGTATPSAAPASPTPGTEGTATASAGESIIVTNFEKFGPWRRGDEPWAEFTQTGEKFTSGKYGGKLAYDFPADVPDDRNYVVFLQTLPIQGKPDELRLQVLGDKSGAILNVWIKDATGQRWQFSFGPITHTGWRRMKAPLDTTLKWPVQLLEGSGKPLTYPLTFEALVLDYPTNEPAHGVIYIDQLTAVSAK